MSSALLEDVALFDVMLDGADVDAEVQSRITEIRVLNYLALPDLCTFDVGFDIEDFDKQPFEIGKELEIMLGSPAGNTTSSLFKGEVVSVHAAFKSGGVTARVRALDKAHRLQRSRKVRTFSDMTLSDIASKVIGESGLSADIDSSLSLNFEHCQQDNETDWDFLWRLARRAGAELFVQGNTAILKKPESETPIELTWPTDVREFKGEVTSTQQVSEVSIRAWDAVTGEPLEQTASSPNQISEIGIDRKKVAGAFDSTTHIATAKLGSLDEGRALAQSMLDQLANGYVACEGICQGNTRIRAGELLKISGVGQAFSGTYRCLSSTHEVKGGGVYVTKLHSAPVKTILGAVGSSAAHVARDFGAQLTTGIVTNNDDPEELGRVKVKYPHFNDQDEGAWARVALAGAGNQRGMTMLPQPNDEVLVAFFHGDTRHPVVLGSLHNGRNKPGTDLLSDRDGSWVLRSDKHFNVKALETVTIEAAKKMTIKAGEDYLAELSKGATIKVGDAMTLDVGQGLDVKAGQNVTIKSDGGAVEIQGAQSIKLSGPQIEINADAQLKLSGQMVQVQGSQIMLG